MPSVLKRRLYLWHIKASRTETNRNVFIESYCSLKLRCTLCWPLILQTSSWLFSCCNYTLKIMLMTCWFAVVQAQRDVIFELRRIAFDGENDPTGTEKRKAMYTKDYKMLGFTVSLHYRFKSNRWNQAVTLRLSFMSSLSQNHVNPAMDFTQTPPGMLALDNMLYLAKVHQDTYIRVRFDLRCHFARLRGAKASVTPLTFSLTTDCPGEQQPRGQARMSLWPVCHRTHQNALRDPPGRGTAWVFGELFVTPQSWNVFRNRKKWLSLGTHQARVIGSRCRCSCKEVICFSHGAPAMWNNNNLKLTCLSLTHFQSLGVTFSFQMWLWVMFIWKSCLVCNIQHCSPLQLLVLSLHSWTKLSAYILNLGCPECDLQPVWRIDWRTEGHKHEAVVLLSHLSFV